MNRINYSDCTICGSSSISKALETKDYSISKEPYEIWECESCGFHFTQNVPDQEHIAPYYQSEDYISHSDTKKGIVNNLYHRVRQIMLARKYKIVKKYSRFGKLLDYGAGTGYFPGYVKSQGHDVEAIEIDPEARAYAQKTFGISVHEPAALVNNTFQDGQFDAITLWHAMEHLYDPKSYLVHFRKLLAENGHLIIAVPNYTSKDCQYYGKHWAAYDVPRHLWHFSPSTMRQLGKHEGFTLVDKQPMPFDSFYVSLLSEKYKNGKTGLLGGFRRGFASYRASASNVDRCSSVIYVFRKVG